MTNALPLHWWRRRWDVVLMAAAFALGVFLGLILAVTWEVDRLDRQSERHLADAMADIRSRPTVHQRLDAIDQRLDALADLLSHGHGH